ncbi:beta-propeller fold lactonase family protein [Companilactobacillus kimchii]|uniref:beta-propeller fold lactonase family protein n=1 Tax=Companilactobacillus kimchii TaxID=2801452 RepID=UPI0006D21965|nr:beta-propeller fold lactonase family protein [Companilactobacillus kimchii]
MKDKFILGGYTEDSYTPHNQSEGMYVATLDTDEKKIIDISLLAKVDNPAFLNYSETDGKIATVLTKDGNQGGVGIVDVKLVN